MSERNLGAAALEQEQLSVDQICEYLESHPEFFINNEEILEDLRIPHHHGQAISLVERQMEVLRKRIREQESRLARLIATGRENEKLFDKTRNLTLALLDAGSLDEVGAAIEDGFREHFGTDACSLLLLREEFGDSAGNVRTVSKPELAECAPNIASLAQSRGGAFPKPMMEFLFQLHDQPMQSAMVAPLASGAPATRIGLLALGSTDRAHFSESVGTAFLDYVGEVLARALQPYRI